jgi:hypothetical protein
MMGLFRAVAAGLAALSLTGCAAEAIWDSDEAVARATYRAPGPATVTLITSINARNGSGAHSALLIDGAQRLLFDPAGSWHNPGVPERHDVLFGMSPRYLDAYVAFQSNGIYEVQTQTIQVSAEVAQQLSQRVQAYGPVAPADCSRSISEILGSTPGFESITQTFFPLNTMGQMSQIPGVREERILGTSPEEQAALEAAQG